MDDAERYLAALWKIRRAGRNEDSTAQWMQVVAAHAINPNIPESPPEPPKRHDEK